LIVGGWKMLIGFVHARGTKDGKGDERRVELYYRSKEVV